MATLKHDIIEVWHFKNRIDANTRNTNLSVGYEKVVDGVLKEQTGELTNTTYMKSSSEVEDIEDEKK